MTGDNGLLNKVGQAKIEVNEGEIKEQIQLLYAEYQMEKNMNTSLEEFVKNNLQRKYGTENVTITKMGKNCKIDISSSKRVYILKYDGTIKEINKVDKMSITDVYSYLDENGTLYLRSTEKNNYNQATIKNGKYGFFDFQIDNKESVLKVIIEEPIAPSDVRKMFKDFTNISSIENMEYLHTENITNMSEMFLNCSSLTKLDLSNFDTDMVENMHSMFEGCTSLISLDLTFLNTSTVTSMVDMFWKCQSLTSIDASSFNTSNVEDMSYMFNDCSSVVTLDLSSFDVRNVKKMNRMFLNCSSLKELDLSTFETSSLTSFTYMLHGTNILEKLDIRKIDLSNANGGIYSFPGNHNVNIITNESTATWIEENLNSYYTKRPYNNITIIK